MRLVEALPSLRSARPHRTLCRAIAAAQERAGRLGGGFRVVHDSIQSNHLHLLVEARDRLHLSRGMQGLQIRIARALNKLWQRRGSLFADRYHDRILRTPREVRHAIAYVLNNIARHTRRALRRPDPFSSARAFDPWRNRAHMRDSPLRPRAPTRAFRGARARRDRAVPRVRGCFAPASPVAPRAPRAFPGEVSAERPLARFAPPPVPPSRSERGPPESPKTHPESPKNRATPSAADEPTTRSAADRADRGRPRPHGHLRRATRPQIVKYFAAGWWHTSADVDCSGQSWDSSLMRMPMRLASRRSSRISWSSRFGHAG